MFCDNIKISRKFVLQPTLFIPEAVLINTQHSAVSTRCYGVEHHMLVTPFFSSGSNLQYQESHLLKEGVKFSETQISNFSTKSTYAIAG